MLLVYRFYWEGLRRIDERRWNKHVDRIKYNKITSKLENNCERNEHRTIIIRNFQEEKVQ